MEMRAKLSEEIPLSVPKIVQIFPVYACNLRCEYCIFSMPESQRGYISDEKVMTLDTYRKCIDDICEFDSPLKMLRFAAMGEPLLHPQITEMVRYAKERKVAASVEIVTNATLLNERLSEQLVDAGLDRIRISLEGLRQEHYLKHSGIKIDTENFFHQIAYLHAHKAKTRIYIKIIDYMLESLEDKQMFYQRFSNICDEIAVEHLTPTIEEIDFQAFSNKKDYELTQNGNELLAAQVCPMPFYFMQINPDGNVVPCCSTKYPAILGNIREESLKQIWNGQRFMQLRLQMLNGASSACDVCKTCNLFQYGMHVEDYLDNSSERIKSRLLKYFGGV